jgi:hypothetical protein
MNRLGLFVLASTGCMLVLGEAASAQEVERAERLRGGNENPPVISDGTGRFRAEVFDNRLEFRLRYEIPDNDVTQAHLHVANPGNNGGIVVFLCARPELTPPGVTTEDCPPSPGLVTGVIRAEDVREITEGNPAVTVIQARDLAGLIRLIQQGSVYANVHTDVFTAGEIRGQLNSRER